MADKVFETVLPPLKAIDNGDGTYSMSVIPIYAVPPGGTDTVFTTVKPNLKAVDFGDGTYLLSVKEV